MCRRGGGRRAHVGYARVDGRRQVGAVGRDAAAGRGRGAVGKGARSQRANVLLRQLLALGPQGMGGVPLRVAALRLEDAQPSKGQADPKDRSTQHQATPAASATPAAAAAAADLLLNTWRRWARAAGRGDSGALGEGRRDRPPRRPPATTPRAPRALACGQVANVPCRAPPNGCAQPQPSRAARGRPPAPRRRVARVQMRAPGSFPLALSMNSLASSVYILGGGGGGGGMVAREPRGEPGCARVAAACARKRQLRNPQGCDGAPKVVFACLPPPSSAGEPSMHWNKGLRAAGCVPSPRRLPAFSALPSSHPAAGPRAALPEAASGGTPPPPLYRPRSPPTCRAGAAWLRRCPASAPRAACRR
jgi:hypothetical protein